MVSFGNLILKNIADIEYKFVPVVLFLLLSSILTLKGSLLRSLLTIF